MLQGFQKGREKKKGKIRRGIKKGGGGRGRKDYVNTIKRKHSSLSLGAEFYFLNL